MQPFFHHGIRGKHRAGFYAPYWFPYGDIYGYDEGYQGPYEQAAPPEPPSPEPAPVVIQSSEPERPAAEPKIIEIPGSANRAPVKPMLLAVFVFKNGERLEAGRFLLRMDTVSITVNRQQRTIPLDMLDLDATLAANHERGIDLRIPFDSSEISLSF